MPKVNEIWYVDLSPSRGREISGIRKCLVVDDFGDGLYQIAPYTPFSYGEDAEPMFEQIRTVDKVRFRERVK